MRADVPHYNSPNVAACVCVCRERAPQKGQKRLPSVGSGPGPGAGAARRHRTKARKKDSYEAGLRHSTGARATRLAPFTASGGATASRFAEPAGGVFAALGIQRVTRSRRARRSARRSRGSRGVPHAGPSARMALGLKGSHPLGRRLSCGGKCKVLSLKRSNLT